MSRIEARVETISLVGGELCLDWANTVDWHASDHPDDPVVSYEDLVRWSRHAGILTDDEARELLRRAKARPKEAAAVLKEAIEIREVIYRIFVAVAGGEKPDAADISRLNEALAQAMRHTRVVGGKDGFRWEWGCEQDALDRMLCPIVRSAADLLTSERLHWVGQCADDRGCGWLFVDTSRNHSRRWCDIKGCGNRAKARRHQARKRVTG